MKLMKILNESEINEKSLDEFTISSDEAYQDAINRLPELLKLLKISGNKILSLVTNDVKNGKYTYLDLMSALRVRGSTIGALNSEIGFLRGFISDKGKKIKSKEKKR